MNETERPDRLSRHLAITFVLAIIFYSAAFAWIEHRRVAKGPWQLTFLSDASNQPALRIAQSQLHICETLRFPGEQAGRANLYVEVQLRHAVANLPFGSILFQDSLFLPGTATLRLFGHTVELLPRTLIIDHAEQAWEPGKEMSIPRDQRDR